MRGLGVAVLALPACTVGVDFGGTRYACPDERCPSGYLCVASECVEVPPDGAPLVDGAGPDVPAAARCGSVTLLADDFDDGVRSEAKWGAWYLDAGTSLDESSGEVVIGLAPNASGSAYAGYGSSDHYDLRDGRFSVRAVSTPNPNTSAQMALYAAFGTGDVAQIRVAGDQLQCLQVVGGVETILRSRQFNPNPHRFWALREAAGTLAFETSGDGLTWAAQAETPTPFDVEYVRLLFGAGTWQAIASPGQAVFDDFNGGLGQGAWCAASSLVDDFADGVRGRAWARGSADPGCTIAEADGAVTVSLSEAQVAACEYASSARYDLEGDSVTLEVSSVGAAMAQTHLSLRDAEGRQAVVLVESGMLIARTLAGPDFMNVTAVPYDATAHRLWRLRGDGGTVRWETAGDGGSFSELAAVEGALDLRAVLIAFGAGTWTATPTPGTARFEGINLP